MKRTLDDDAGRPDAVRRAGNLAALAVVVFGIFLRAILALGGVMAAIVVVAYLALGRYLNLIGDPPRR